MATTTTTTNSGGAAATTTAAAATAAEQWEAVSALHPAQLVEGEACFLVAIKWWQLWRAFATAQQPSPPGPIDNTPLLASDDNEDDCAEDATATTATATLDQQQQPSQQQQPQEAKTTKTKTSKKGGLRRGLVSGVDFVVVPRRAWEWLVAWHGLVEPPGAIARKAIPMGVYRRLVLELYPVEVVVFDCKSIAYTTLPFTAAPEQQQQGVVFGQRNPMKVFTFARSQLLREVRWFLGSWANVAPHLAEIFLLDDSLPSVSGSGTSPGSISLDQALQHSRLLSDNARTLEELGVNDGARLVIRSVSRPFAFWMPPPPFYLVYNLAQLIVND